MKWVADFHNPVHRCRSTHYTHRTMKLPINIDDKVHKIMKTELVKRKMTPDEFIELLIRRELKIK